MGINGRTARRAAAGLALLLSTTGCAAAIGAADAAAVAADYARDCDDLADQAAEIFAPDGELLKVREPKMKTDNSADFQIPATGDATRMVCIGTGVWGEGGYEPSPVLLTETVDSDGEQFVAWEAL